MSAPAAARRLSRMAIYAATIILLAIIASIAVPIAQGRVTAIIPSAGSFAEQTGGGTVYFNGTIQVTNRGFYPIEGMRMNSTVVSTNGTAIYSYSSILPAIPSGDVVDVPISVQIPVSVVKEIGNSSVSSGTNVTIVTVIHGIYAMSAISFSLTLSSSVLLQAPPAVSSCALEQLVKP